MEFELIKKDLQNSGSLAARDRQGVSHKAAMDNDKEGFIYAPTKKRIYNTDELKKALNIDITELIPESANADLDLVPRPLYNEATQSLNEALQIIDDQSVTISNLESDVSVLLATSAALDVRLDGERLLRVTAEANGEQLRKQFSLVNDSLQTSLERSVLEGIERVSLKSRTEGQGSTIQSLSKQVDSLTQQLNGKNAQIAAGAKAGGNITARIIEKTDANGTDIAFDVKTGASTGKWNNGPTIELFNSGLESEKIDIELKNTQPWLTPLSVTLAPQEKRTVTLTGNFGVINGLDPRPRTFLFFGGGKATDYKGSVSVKSPSGEISFSANLYKHRS
jgi:hypothetical protein